MATAELLLHPVRLRIVQAFLGESELTTAQLRVKLPEIPAATLYRQVATLTEGDLLEVVAERRIRGAVERTFRLRTAKAGVTGAEAATMGAQEHRQAFMVFVAALLADFDRYLDGGDPDLTRDGVGYRQTGLYLSDDELPELVAEISAVLAPWLARPAAPGRTRRLLTTVVMPG
ncbi:helix-turn-helix domain-containing protein [Micromonospora sp. NBC_01813]|uniref:helix-turn-helix domain-containing protein n=1 Tax=Micromonospora sp. NBC_01813 TaxID=2975988 RepID=UPI002DD849FA|nr:helix-turn-helix domain-containing protein [Micromonospora sp. NBC_01813]WSA06656.1 helix-turn-helix domain-containing protein [Micromonospora sp. NBC_01813]